MDAKSFARGLCQTMLRYQRREGIVNQCLTNAMYLYDSLKQSFPRLEVKVKPSIVLIVRDENDFILNTGHLVVEFEGELYDASYDIQHHENKNYFQTIQELSDTLPRGDNPYRQRLREVVSNFLLFVKHAQTINDGGLVVSDRDYYDRQADYVESCIRRR